MLKPGRGAIFLIETALSICILSAAEQRRDVAGTSAYPLVRADGGLTLVYRSSPGGVLASSAQALPGGPLQEQILGSSPSIGAPVVKRDARGGAGMVWAEHDGRDIEILYGRIDGDAISSIRMVARGADLAMSCDLDFDAASNPWIAWVRVAGGRSSVSVTGLAEDRTWIVNGRMTASALQPRIVATPAQGIWVFWTGRDGDRDEIFAAVRRAGAWSEPMHLDVDKTVPHFGASAALDADGFPWVVWSEYDGSAYRIFTSSWDGASWSAPAKLSVGGGSDISPAAARTSGGAAIVVWSRAEAGTAGLVARYRSGTAWSPEIRITGDAEAAARSPRISVSGETIGLAWDAGESARSLVLTLPELAAKTPSAAQPQSPPPVLDPNRDENQYTCFGDSITYANGDQGYEPRLQPMLVQKYGGATLWNEGIGGESTIDGLARFDQTLAAHASRFLMLMEGTNDIIFDQFSMDTSAYNLDQMVQKSVTAGVLPLIATIIPRKDWHWSDPFYQNRIFDLNTRIRAVAAGRKIPLVDQFNVFYYYSSADGGWQSLILDDGVHPNPKGFDIMAATWFDGITILPFAPVGLRLTRESDRILFAERLYDVLRWQNSPKSAAGQIVGFRIYRKERADSVQAFALVTTIAYLDAATDYRYLDGQIVKDRAYAYLITALRKDGVEGPASALIVDIP